MLNQISIAIAVFTALTSSVKAQTFADFFPEKAKLLASDGAANDSFGFSVSISGTSAVVGAYLDDDYGLSSGSAYVFEQQGDGSWLQISKLIPSDSAANDLFGYSVSISGSTLVVGASRDTANGSDSGSAYVFERQPDGSWLETAKLLASDGAMFSYFGESISISEASVIVGADGVNDNGAYSGGAYIFEQQGDGSWLETAKLLASDGVAVDYFGDSVSISGTTAVVGAYGRDDNGSDSGSAYIFEQQGNGSWLETAKLLASDGVIYDLFGRSVSISGTTAFVGAQGDDDNGTSSGSAYIFEQQVDGSWLETTKLIASDGAADDAFGRCVSISGTSAVVGATWDDDTGANSGSAYIFEQQVDGSWLESKKLLASDGSAFDTFGNSVSISGTTFLVGAYNDNDNGLSSGSAYIYQSRSVLNLETGLFTNDLPQAIVDAQAYDRLAVRNSAFNTPFINLGATPINFICMEEIQLQTELTMLLSDATTFIFSNEVPVGNQNINAGGAIHLPVQGRVTVDGTYVGVANSFLYQDGGSFVATSNIASSSNTTAYLSGTLFCDTVSTSDAATNYIYANTMVLGDYLNNATTIVQSGVLSITGTLTNNGILLGTVDTGPPPFRGGPRVDPPVAGDGMSIGGSYIIGSSASLRMLDFDWTLRVGGNFDCAINNTASYFMIGSTLVLSGLNQTSELMSLDIGATIDGLDPLQAGHFPIGTFKVGAGATVDLVDTHDNASDGFVTCEALYVDTLIVKVGGILNTNGCPVYAVNQIIDGVVIGDVTPIGDTTGCAGDINGDGVVDVADILIVIAEWGCTGACLADTNGDNIVDVTDLLQVIADFGGAC